MIREMSMAFKPEPYEPRRPKLVANLLQRTARLAGHPIVIQVCLPGAAMLLGVSPEYFKLFGGWCSHTELYKLQVPFRNFKATFLT
jgi:hypothetical protein